MVDFFVNQSFISPELNSIAGKFEKAESERLEFKARCEAKALEIERLSQELKWALLGCNAHTHFPLLYAVKNPPLRGWFDAVKNAYMAGCHIEAIADASCEPNDHCPVLHIADMAFCHGYIKEQHIHLIPPPLSLWEEWYGQKEEA